MAAVERGLSLSGQDARIVDRMTGLRSVAALAVLCLGACGYEDRSPKPVGDWRQIVDGSSDGVHFQVWEADSNNDGRTCLNTEVSPPSSFPLPRDEPELYKGREAACTSLPNADEPVNLLRFSESDRYGLFMITLPPDTSASLQLASRERVENVAGEDSSSDLNVFVGIYDSAGRADVLTLDGPNGKTVCRFDPHPDGRSPWPPSCDQ
jgi:hypothetical protein